MMHDKKSLILIAGAIFSATILLAQGNIEKAFAITLTSAEPDGTFEIGLGVGYNSVKDYLLTTAIEGGVVHLHVIEGATLTQIADIPLTILSQQAGIGTDGIVCSASLCFLAGQTDLSPSNKPTVVRINMVTLTVSATYAEAEYVGCIITNLEFFGTNIYATMADFGSCPYTGVYQLSTGFTSDLGAGNIQWIEYDSSTSVGDTSHITGSCLIEGRYFIMGHTASNLVRKYDLSTKSLTSSASLGASPTELHCDTTSSGYVYVTSINGDWVKRVKISDLSIAGDQMSVTNPRHLMQRGDSVYVSRSDSTTITVGNKVALNNQFVMFTGLAHNDLFFFKGNATRFNMLAPSTNDNIFYRVEGVFDDTVEPTTGETFCLDTDGDGFGDVCYDDTNGDGIPDVGGVLEVITNQNPPQRATGKLLCQIGIITDCTDNEPTDTDPKTNGTGLLMFVALLVVLMAVTGSALYGKIKIEYNLMLQIAILLIASGLAVAFGWIDQLWFYAMLFIIIGFASIAGASFIMPRVRGGSGE